MGEIEAMAPLARVKAFACFAAVHSSEVQLLDGDEVRQDGATTPEMTVEERDGKKVPVINREAFFRGDIDSDEASLDNGDDSNLSELWSNAASQQGDLGSRTTCRPMLQLRRSLQRNQHRRQMLNQLCPHSLRSVRRMKSICRRSWINWST